MFVLGYRSGSSFRILGFGFSDRIVFVCWYKDGKEWTGFETFSIKELFCPTKVKFARRKEIWRPEMRRRARGYSASRRPRHGVLYR